MAPRSVSLARCTGRGNGAGRDERRPSTSERLVQPHQAGGRGPFALVQLVLERQQGTLCLQYAPKIDQARAILGLRQFHGTLGGLGRLTQGLPTALLMRVSDEGVFHLFQDREYGRLLLDQGLLPER